MSTNTQSRKIETLNKIIGECNAFKDFPKENLIVLPTGDGVAIGFVNGIEKPIELSKEIHEKLQHYNKNKESINEIQIRIGIHYGNVFQVKDMFENKNFWGPGLILARRIMDIGEERHILLTSSIGKILSGLSNKYKKIIHPIYNKKTTYVNNPLLYSVYGEGFGNSVKPTKILYEKKDFQYESDQTQRTVTCKNVEFSLFLKDSNSNLVEHKRRYDLINNSDEPIYEITNGIITSIEKSFQDLGIKILDDKKRELIFARIGLDTSYRKEFVIKLDPPILKNEKGRNYNLTYSVEEPRKVYENLFLINSKKLIYNFRYPTMNLSENPKLFVIEKNNREKNMLEIHSKKTDAKITHIQWVKDDGIMEKDLIRIEWGY